MSEFIEMIFTDLSVNSISLSVFSNNNKAPKLYEKHGFEIYEVIDGREKKYRMKKNAGLAIPVLFGTKISSEYDQRHNLGKFFRKNPL